MYGLYLELQQSAKPDEIAQYIFVGNHTLAGKLTPMAMFSRQVSPERPQPPWLPNIQELDPTATDKTPRVTATGQFARKETVEASMNYAREIYEKIGNALDGAAVWGWAGINKPLVFEIGDLDAQALAEHRTPKQLISRIMNLRDKEGFPALPKKATV